MASTVLASGMPFFEYILGEIVSPTTPQKENLDKPGAIIQVIDKTLYLPGQIRHVDHRTALHTFFNLGLRYREHILEDGRPERKDGAVHAKGYLVSYEDDVPVIEPERVVPLDISVLVFVFGLVSASLLGPV